jgi:ribosomal-protein-alanine N-acetyltransferase
MEVYLEKLNLSDLDDLCKYADNVKIFNNLTDQFPHPFTREKGVQFIERQNNAEVDFVLAIKAEKAFVGCIGVHEQADVYRKNAEMGYWVAEEFWGKGIITKAIPLMIKYAFENFEFNRIFARPYDYNIASQRALEKAGFALEALLKGTFYKNGEYLDELIYAVRRK